MSNDNTPPTNEIAPSAIAGMSKNDAMTHLISQSDLSYAEATKFWAEHGSKASVGFAAGFYDDLRSGEMDDETFDALIAEGSNNVQKHKKHFDAIRLLANDIHNQA